VERGLINKVGILLKERLPSIWKYAVVTNDTVYRIHGEKLMKALDAANIDIGLTLVPDGEEAKSWSSTKQLMEELIDLGLDRRSAVIAFGGGTVGDLSGFVSSIFLRGISFVQVPTTLLAQVDSSIGGKAAINHPRGKNLIGSFHQPALVVSDTDLTITLSKMELISGLGEVVKYGVIADSDLFNIMEEKCDRLVDADLDLLTNVVRRCVEIKARFVEQDERDTKGIRASLNYGHTLGHVLEYFVKLELRHGEAIAIGMIVAANISERLGLMEADDVARQEMLLKKIGFRVQLRDLDLKELIEAMHRDKKSTGGSINFVLPTGIGHPPILRTIPDRLMSQVMEDMGFG
jgi:3-dehydroquinate synthase